MKQMMIFLLVAGMFSACQKEKFVPMDELRPAEKQTETVLTETDCARPVPGPGRNCEMERRRKMLLANPFLVRKLLRECNLIYQERQAPDFERMRKENLSLWDFALVRLEVEGVSFYLPMHRDDLPAGLELPYLNAARAYCPCEDQQAGEMLASAPVGQYRLYWCNSCSDCEPEEMSR